MAIPRQYYIHPQSFLLFLRYGAILSLCLVLRISSGYAQGKSYFFHTEKYDIEQGLDHNVIGDFQADENGMIWVYTVGGIQLFDGYRFTKILTPLDDGFTGRFSSGHGDGLFFLSGYKLIRLNTQNYVDTNLLSLVLPPFQDPQRSPFLIYENRNRLFIAHSNDTIYAINKKKVRITEKFTLPDNPNRSIFIRELSRNGFLDDKIEYFNEDKQLCTFDLTTQESECLTLRHNYRSHIRISKDSFFILTSKSLDLYTGGKIWATPLPDSVQGISGKFFLRLSSDKILVATQKDIHEFNIRTMQWSGIYSKPAHLPLIDISVRMMEKDGIGNLYFSTFNQGLIKLYPRNESFDYIGSLNKKQNFVHSLAVSDSLNLVVVGTLQEGLILYDTAGRFLHQFPKLDNLNRTYINSICKLSESRYLITALNSYLLTTDGKHHKITLFQKNDPQWQSYYDHFISKPGSHIFYNSTDEGLVTIADTTQLTISFQQDHPLNGAIAVANYNEGFVSFHYNVLKIYSSDFVHVIDTFNLPRLGHGRCILQSGATQVLIGTDMGLFEINISETITILKRHYNKLVYSILPADDDFWFSTDFGLYHLNSKRKITHFSREYGLQENEFNSNAGLVSPSGKLYFGGINGITSFYPKAVTAVRDSIIPFISNLVVNNVTQLRYFIPHSDTTFTFSNREGNISIELLGRGRKSPTLYNYQYYLNGLNDYWIDLKNSPKINFQLAPGHYEFFYAITDQFNPDAPKLNGFKIYIEPPFYVRWWFVSGVMLILAGMIYYMVRLQRRRRVMKLRYEFELREKLHNERMRISRELHDNIGAQMATVKRNINFLIDTPLTPVQHTQKMKDLESISTQINQELRDSIWATQHEYISVGDFITRLKNYVFQVLGQESNVRVSYIENCDKEILLGPFVTLNLHRICQESINNILKHSSATEIKICFEGDLKCLKITLKDNGAGFDMNTIHEGYGLRNMKQRAEQVNAKLNIITKAGEGTTLEIELNSLETYKSMEI